MLLRKRSSLLRAKYSLAKRRPVRGYLHRLATARQSTNVSLGSLADIGRRISDVRFTPKSGHTHDQDPCPLSAKKGHSATAPRNETHDADGSTSQPYM